ncbi:PGC-1 and ERR-induced regulator in muscle protein 1 [Stegostoma tigrinum]|uniref:PGC-1 and ERR-induced regulator in muscle protein 1 n=1 Tax=Stegostoma tigrinum TaxID=3053191 RepID=UPI00202AF621|nr:PGC-1 and ERR-induced regulator in muscle protein 1 [Stegostoma tigrinum]
MDDFGYSFHQGERDWPLFDSVPEECQCILKPSLATSEDSDLSEDSEKILRSHPKRSKRVNLNRSRHSPGPADMAMPCMQRIDRGEGLAMFRSRGRPTLAGHFSLEHESVIYSSEDVLSAAEDELELELVNEFLTATGHTVPRGNLSRGQQRFLISGESLQASRTPQHLLASTSEASYSTHPSNSITCTMVNHSHDRSACTRPSFTLDMDDYAENVLDHDCYKNHIEMVKDDHLDVGFRYSQGHQEHASTLPELWDNALLQGQHNEIGETAASNGTQSQSVLEKDFNAQAFATVSEDNQFPTSRDPSPCLELKPAAKGKLEEDYSITCPEIYEYFYEDFGEEGDDDALLFLRVPSVFKRVKRGNHEPRKINLLTIIKSLVHKYLHPTQQGQTALVSFRSSNTAESTRAYSSSDLGSLNNALVKYSEGEGSQTMMESTIQRGRGHSCLSCTRKDFCLFCFACASWAMKSAASQSDMWKAALLVNISAISAVRYFRTLAKRENSKYLALQDSEHKEPWEE